jgi:hypothetical protein
MALHSVEKHFQEGSAELQIPPLRSPDFLWTLGGVDELRAPFSVESRIRGSCECHEVGNPGTLRSELVTFLIWPVVCGWKAGKSICQQASPGSFDYAP